MNGNAKSSFVCVRDEKSWNIEPNKTNSSLKTLNNNVIKIVLKHWTKGNKESIFKFVLISNVALSHEVSAYIYIYWLIDLMGFRLYIDEFGSEAFAIEWDLVAI